MQIRSKAEAQRRADQIAIFRAELAHLEQEQVVCLDPDQQAALGRYHGQLLRWLATAYDIDVTHREKQLSLGMRITAFIGALGLAASLFFFYFQLWGTLSTSRQVTILVAMPLFSLLCTMATARIDTSGYFAQLFALVSLVSLVLNLTVLGEIFNLPPSPLALLIWSVFAFLLAYAVHARLLLAMAILCLAAFLSAQAATWNGCYWISFGEQPEMFLPAAVLLFLVSLVPHHRFLGFSALYRVLAMLLFFLPILILSNWGTASVLDFPEDAIEAGYQISGFVVSAGLIGLGIARGWPEVVNTANVFLTLFLYTKFYDWWWEWMPKYQFFLIIGASAMLMLLVLKWLRHLSIQRKGEKAP
jgi:hypothetical protein